MGTNRKVTSFAWFVLVFNLGVILWGAYVRATGAGAGCGSHWPLCNGEVIPRSPQVETMIEFIHRATSGLAFLFVLVLFFYIRRSFENRHKARKAATWSLVFIISEALIGAGLVLFGWVAMDQSIGRVISITLHLVNTLILLAALSLTAWWSSGYDVVVGITSYRKKVLTVIGMVGVIFLGVSGAITALGDTLFPMESIALGLQADFSATSHFLIRLRIWHPLIAVIVGIFWIYLAGSNLGEESASTIKFIRIAIIGVIVLQFVAGAINVILLAPVWMQLVHLLFADLAWILIVLFSGSIGGIFLKG